MSDRRVEFWAVRDGAGAELCHCTLYEAVGEYLEYDLEPSDWPETITVTGYARQVVEAPTIYEARSLLEGYVEDLEVEYGADPDSPSPWALASDDEIATVLAVLRAIAERFEPYLCDPMTSREVDVTAWLRKYRPHWLANDNKQEDE